MFKSTHQLPKRLRLSLMACAWAALGGLATPESVAGPVAQVPLYLAQRVAPRLMLLMSRDEQLFGKAYTDWSDIKPPAIDDGTLDTTYNDNIDYYGYFDFNKCYTYSSANGYFSPASAATGTNQHQCSGQWSGNFLNWATMTRMDVVRKVLYGGYRSIDVNGNTVLERALLPTDAHAFVKVFNPNSTATVRLYTPYTSSTAISICNVSYATSGNTSSINAGNNQATSPAPLLRMASGTWPAWASTEIKECFWREDDSTGSPYIDNARPSNSGKTTDGSALPTEINARVQVCVNSSGVVPEANCKTYPNGGSPNKKPTGVLQKYGESGGMYFSLVTGSYEDNKSGGVLRKSMGPIAGDTAALNNEIDTNTGLFINQGASNAGIINTINRLRIAQFNFGDFGTGARYTDNCGLVSSGQPSFTNGNCSDWGNPLSEMYLEALRYFAGATSPTSGFNSDDSSDIPSLPQGNSVTGNLWSVDAVPDTQWCAKCNILVLSTGLSSFDTDDLSGASPLTGLDVTGQTNTIGAQEGINSNTFFIGQNATSTDGRCTAKTLGGLADAKGLCPEAPFLQGGYQIGGLAYYAHTNTLRATNSTRKGPLLVNTYAVQLADTLPKYSIPVGSGTVNLVPACEANSSPAQTPPTAITTMDDTNWRVCSLLDLRPEPAAKDSSGNVITMTVNGVQVPATGSFQVAWEDMPWGSDHDMDAITRTMYCVGTACAAIQATDPIYGPLRDTTSSVSSGKIKVATWVLQAYAGHTLFLEHMISGTTEDTTWNPRKYGIVRKGNDNFSCFISSPPASYCTLGSGSIPITGTNDPSSPPYAYAHIYTASTGSSAAGLLQNPLWYAAKWGGFSPASDTANQGQTLPLTTLPLVTTQWDSDNNGVPDNFFPIKNLNSLPTVLEYVLGKVQGAESSSSSVVANSVALNTGTRLYQARFNSGGWGGQLWSYVLNLDGSVGNVEWDAACVLTQNSSCLIDDTTHNTQYSVTPASFSVSSRRIITFKPSTGAGVNPAGVPFLWASLAPAQQTLLNKNPDTGSADTSGQDRLTYLRGDTSNEVRNGGIFRDRTIPRGNTPVPISWAISWTLPRLMLGHPASATPTTGVPGRRRRRGRATLLSAPLTPVVRPWSMRARMMECCTGLPLRMVSKRSPLSPTR